MKMQIPLQLSVLLVLMLLAGCDSGHGPDSLFAPQVGGGATSGCTACHNSTSTIAPDPLVTNGSGTAGKHIRHVQNRGIPCERCHYNYAQTATHMNGTLDTPDPAILIVYFDSLNSSGTWTNDTGPGTGTCLSIACHGGFALDWYGAGLPSCGACHFTQIGSRRSVMGANGDFASNPSVTSHHVKGGSDPTPAQCQVCHEMSQHMAGTVRLNEADTGAVIVYSATSPSTIEPFCLSCHDTDAAGSTFISGGTPSSPFNDGSELGQTPYRAGIDIAANWNKSYGHRQKGLTCLGSGAPGTGCHANGHGAVNVGMLSKNLQIPQPDRYRESDFSICLECHQSYANVTKEVIYGVAFNQPYDWGYGPRQDPLLRSSPTDTFKPPYGGGIRTRFRDQNYDGITGKFYDDPTWFFGDFLNLHWFHTSIQAWAYRGTSLETGISCVACHSVHGSDTQWGMVYDQMQYTVYSAGSDSFGTMLGDLYGLDQYPTYCAFSCHGFFQDFYGPTYNWYEPANE